GAARAHHPPDALDRRLLRPVPRPHGPEHPARGRANRSVARVRGELPRRGGAVSPADYAPILPQIVVLAGAMVLVLLEPFTPEERKGRMAQVAVVTAAVAAFVLSYSSGGPRR